jgi:hypothetical protein
MSNVNKTLIALLGTDLMRLAIPKMPDYNKILFGGDERAHIELMNKQARQMTAAHQIAISGIAPRMVELAKIIEKQYKPAIIAFQTITEKLQPLILQQSRIAEEFKDIAVITNPTIEAIKTLSSFNAFSRYRETFKQFGGFIDPESVTEVEIEQTINQNKELISEVNTILLNAEADGISPDDVPGLIYSFLHDKIPYLSRRTYSIIVLIIYIVIIVYGLYSNITTNLAINNEIIPTLNKNAKILEDLKSNTEGIYNSMYNLTEKVENADTNLNEIKNSFDEFKEDVEEYIEATNDKFDLLYQEMLRQKSKNDKNE